MLSLQNPIYKTQLDSKGKKGWTETFTTKLADKVVSETSKNKWARKNW